MSAPQKQSFVTFARELGLSQRRACRLAGLSRSGIRYRVRPKADEAQLVERLKGWARKRRRRGYRLAYQELRHEGMIVNHKRVYRLWKREGLSVPPRRSRKRVRGVAPACPVPADRPNALWCLDFLEEGILSGGKLRLLCVTDVFTRESLVLEAGKSFGSARVCGVLEELMARRGVPEALRMDNGPEFVALSLRGLCHRHGVTPAYIEAGKPWQNGYAESFHSRLRDEFLDGEVFLSVLDAQVRLGLWRRYWNEGRLHSSLGYLTPHAFAARWAAEAKNGAETKATVGT